MNYSWKMAANTGETETIGSRQNENCRRSIGHPEGLAAGRPILGYSRKLAG
jgi:hypothetical protein